MAGAPNNDGRSLTPGNVRKALTTAERRRKAIQLRILGASYDDIAKQTGIARRNVVQEIRDCLREIPILEVAEYRKMENERLEQLMRAFWSRALAGDTKAGSLMVRISERRSALLGLDRATEGDAGTEHTAGELGRLAKSMPPGMEMKVTLSRVWTDPSVIAAIQKAHEPASIETTATHVEEPSTPDPDEALWESLVAQDSASA